MRNYKKNHRVGKQPTTQAGRDYRDMLKYGGISRWGVETDPDKIARDIQKSFDNFEDKGVRDYFNSLLNEASEQTLGRLDKLGEYAEHSNRLTIFRAALESGLSKDRAAYLAKESTINFDRKGSGGTYINALFLFSNAGIQASTRLLHTFKHDPVSAIKTVASVAAMSAASMMAVYALGYGDEYDEESEWDKLHNIYLPIMWNGRLVKFPAPYGLNEFPYLGQHLVASAVDPHDDRDAQFFDNLMNASGEILNPIGGGNITAIAAFMEIYNNKNFMDLPIYYEDIYNKWDIVNSEHGRHDTGEAYKWAARFTNKMTGGNRNESGIANASPEAIRHLVEAYGGGVYKLGKNMVNIVGGEEDADIPVVRRFLSSTRGNPYTGKFYRTYKQAGAEIFSDDKRDRLKEYFNKAREEGYMDEDRLTSMYEKILDIQQLKRMAAKKGVSDVELKGSAKEKKLESDARKRRRQNK